MVKILVIDDDKTQLSLIKKYLNNTGHKKVILVNSGTKGILSAKKNKPDIILLDLILPKKDGFEVLHELKEDESTRDIPIIIMTNLEGTKDVEKALEFGATTYLVKANYSLDDVVEKIKSILQIFNHTFKINHNFLIST